MTITSEVTEKSYTGNGVTVAFPTTFQFFGTTTSAELTVTERTIATGAEATMTNGVDYTVSGGNGATGTVTATVAPTSLVEWHITRTTTRQQATDYVENDSFPAASHENALDRAAMINQEDNDRYNRTPHFRKSDTYAGGEPHLPVQSDRASKLLGFDANGDFEVNTVADLGTIVVSDNTPGAVGSASAGSSSEVSRSDHTHAQEAGVATLGAAQTFTKTQTWTKGSDVASASSLSLGDGNYFDVTGATAITSIATKGIGTVVKLHFDGALTLTHHATDLILPGGANITTTAGDEAEFVEYASGDWRCTNYQAADKPPSDGILVQQVNTTTGAVATGTTTIPLDDTIPQNTEGDEYMTLSVTPTNAANKLKIDVTVSLSNTSAGVLQVALFQDSTANAIAAVGEQPDGTSTQVPCVISFSHHMTAGTTSATTFKVRAGLHVAGTTTFNGVAGGRLYGGVYASSITISEVAS